MPYKQVVLRGDYGVYRGDIFGDIFKGVKSVAKGVIGGATGAVRSLVTGGNPLIGAATGVIGSFAPTPNLPQLPSPIPVIPGYSGPGTQVVTAGGGMVGISPLGTVGATSGRGMHPNRSTYYTAHGKVMKGTKLVRNRHANYGNARALHRALKRAHGFQHLARAAMSFTMTGKRYGRPHFKSRRRAR